MDQNLEQWRPVVGYEGFYSVSDQGRLRSEDRTDSRGCQRKGKILSTKPDSRPPGYCRSALCVAGVVKMVRVHVLVAEAFIGPRPPGLEVLHGDGGKLDNSLPNLRYGTPVDNAADRIRDDTHNRGERNYNAKLTREQVLLARQLAATGPRGTRSRLAREWGVHRATVNDAVRGARWAWLDAAYASG